MDDDNIYARSAPDAKTAKAQAAAAKATAKALRPWWKKKRFIIPLAFVALMVVAAAAGGGSSDDEGGTNGASNASNGSDGVESNFSTNTDNPPAADVQFETCAQGQIVADVKLRITNHSSKRSDYTISFNLEDASGVVVGDGFASASNVEPGQTAIEDALATANAPFTKCVLKEVERFAS